MTVKIRFSKGACRTIMKHIYEKAITLALVVIFAFSGAALRALAQPAEHHYFRDLASAVGGEDADNFESALQENSEALGFDFALVTVKCAELSDRGYVTEAEAAGYAESCYMDYGYAYDGILLLCVVGGSDEAGKDYWYLLTYGIGTVIFEDLDYFFDDFFDGLVSGDYENIFRKYTDYTAHIVSDYIENGAEIKPEPEAGHNSGTFGGVPACVNESGELHICKNNFPDAAFAQHLRGECSYYDEGLNKTVSYVYDGDGSGGFSESEIARIKVIDCSDCSIRSLEGMEYFRYLTMLECKENDLTSLDVSNYPELEMLSCDNNALTSLDVSRNPELTTLYCSGNQLTSLDVSANSKLEVLMCPNNQLTSLDVSGCPELGLLTCFRNSLTSLDVSGIPALEFLDCRENKLAYLDLSRNSELMTLDCSENKLASLDLSNNTGLKYANLSGNGFDPDTVVEYSDSKTYRVRSVRGVSRKARIWMWVGIGAGVLLLAGAVIAAVIITKRKKSKENQN